MERHFDELDCSTEKVEKMLELFNKYMFSPIYDDNFLEEFCDIVSVEYKLIDIVKYYTYGFKVDIKAWYKAEYGWDIMRKDCVVINLYGYKACSDYVLKLLSVIAEQLEKIYKYGNLSEYIQFRNEEKRYE